MKESQKTKKFLLILGAVVFVVSFLSLFVALLLYQGDRGRQNIAGFIFVGSLIIDVFIIKAAQRIKTTETQHVEANQYVLPYKVGKDKAYLIIFIALGVLLGLVLLGAALSNGQQLSAPTVIDWNNGEAYITIPMWGLIFGTATLCVVPYYIIAALQGIILYPDHLYYYQLGTKKNIFYKEMEKIEIAYAPSQYRANVFVLSIYSKTKSIPDALINLTSIPKKDLVIILNVIHQSAPNAIFNDMAEQMRQGVFSKNIM
jgi:hypothetical protein